jgi:hypothetical protein
MRKIVIKYVCIAEIEPCCRDKKAHRQDLPDENNMYDK